MTTNQSRRLSDMHNTRRGAAEMATGYNSIRAMRTTIRYAGTVHTLHIDPVSMGKYGYERLS